jgi:hypothetical protein
MMIYGAGVLKMPGSNRVVHDFADGPFETVNPILIAEAKRLGFSSEKPIDKPVEVVKAKQKHTKKAKNEI